MSINEDDIIQILKIMDGSTFDYLHVETGDLKIVVNKSGCPVSPETGPLAPNDITAPTIQETDRPTAGGPRGSLPAVDKPDSLENERIFEKEIAEQGLIPIKSPMLGTFYAGSKPGEPPFVEVGSRINKDAAVCIIEVMKLFSSISAGVQGRVKRVCVEDCQLVEYGQILFLVDPDVD